METEENEYLYAAGLCSHSTEELYMNRMIDIEKSHFNKPDRHYEKGGAIQYCHSSVTYRLP
jgi:hypothetical protein